MHNLFALLFILAFGLGGCAFPYRVDVPQGNIVTAEAVQNLKPGMTKRQVRFLLGSPSLNDPFHPDRWDYVYSVAKAGQERDTEKLTLIFNGDTLVTIESDGRIGGGIAQEQPPAPVM